jgi:hypothetical protein
VVEVLRREFCQTDLAQLRLHNLLGDAAVLTDGGRGAALHRPGELDVALDERTERLGASCSCTGGVLGHHLDEFDSGSALAGPRLHLRLAGFLRAFAASGETNVLST